MKVELRKFNITDYFKILRLVLNRNYSGEFSQSFFKYIYQGVKNIFAGNRLYKFAILVNKKLAGSVGLFKIKKDYELGYFVLKEFRNKGVATQASKKVLDFAFKKLKLKKVIAITDINAKFSEKILRKLRFKKMRENKKEKEFIWERKK